MTELVQSIALLVLAALFVVQLRINRNLLDTNKSQQTSIDNLIELTKDPITRWHDDLDQLEGKTG